MAMTVVEKILARASGRDSVAPGEYLEIRPTSNTVLASHNGKLAGAVLGGVDGDRQPR